MNLQKKDKKSETKSSKLPLVSKKKKNKRNSTKNPALKKHLNLRSRAELIDYDYLHKLDEKELAWLNQFTEEYINAHIPKNKPLHKTKKLRKDCYSMNNKRNADFFNNILDRNVDAYELDGYHNVGTHNDNSDTKIDMQRLNTILKKITEKF